MVVSVVSKICRVPGGMLDPAGEGTMVLQSIKNYIPIDKLSYHEDLKFQHGAWYLKTWCERQC
jgi:hypothetical protein